MLFDDNPLIYNIFENYKEYICAGLDLHLRALHKLIIPNERIVPIKYNIVMLVDEFVHVMRITAPLLYLFAGLKLTRRAGVIHSIE